MKKIIFPLLFLASIFLTNPGLALGEEIPSAGPATFAGSYTLWIAIILGFVASLMTWYYGRSMAGSRIGKILKSFGVGMLLVVLGFLVVVIPWTTPDIQKITHDLLFILGYIFMLFGVLKIKKLAV